MKKAQFSSYFSYLLRLWRERETAPWRATVEDPHTGERWGFANLRQFIAFLEEQTGEVLSQRRGDET